MLTDHVCCITCITPKELVYYAKNKFKVQIIGLAQVIFCPAHFPNHDQILYLLNMSPWLDILHFFLVLGDP